MISATSAIETVRNILPTPRQIIQNGATISAIALPIIALSTIPVATAGIISYTACVATCPAMAAMAPPPLFAYTFEACMASCSYMLSPVCP